MADREADLGADLQELQANRLTLSASQGGLLQSETTQGVHEHVGGGGQIQPELIGAHRCRAGPVGEQIQLLFFYAVLHVAPRTVEVFVERAGPQAFRRQGGDDESGIGAFLQELGLADDASLRGPTVASPVAEILEHPRRCPGGVDIGTPQPGAQQMLPREDVQREITVVAVVTVKEPAFLLAMDRVVGRIQIQHDLLGRRGR